jgi:formylglycine-generating enzyme
MGSPREAKEEKEEEGRGNDEIPHEVSFAHGFWLADTACTQEIWKAVTGENPSHFQNEEDSIQELPVETVSFDDVQAFLTQLNERIGKEATFSLPTEAQWEYACRAGTNTPFSFGKSISTDQANFNGDYPYADSAKGEFRKRTVAVKSLPCNAWGLYQMHGNVWEWCSDWYAEYSQDDFSDPQGPDSGSYRVIRGGSWINIACNVRSASRWSFDPGYHDANLGFRLLSSAS